MQQAREARDGFGKLACGISVRSHQAEAKRALRPLRGKGKAGCESTQSALILNIEVCQNPESHYSATLIPCDSPAALAAHS